MFVLTVDQRHSRRSGDRIEPLLRDLAGRQRGTVRGFERTAGDEVQGVLDHPAGVVDLVTDLVRQGEWSIGVGIGPVDLPLPASTRAGSGAAFTLARDAVTRAKSRPTGLAVSGASTSGASHAQAALDLLAALAQRRTDRGWEAVDLAARGLSQVEIAEQLGVSKQAVSQRLQAADWHLERPARELAGYLLAAADGSGPADRVERP
jgi:DNA-binding CsgD family transcriptional regulator